MKQLRNRLPIIVAFLLSMAFVQAQDNKKAKLKPAPDFEYPTYSGKTFKLSENKGKYVVLDFWGTWCKPCMEEMPKLKEFLKATKDKVELVGIAVGDQKKDGKK